jgi:putative FmdB family regulatory protein
LIYEYRCVKCERKFEVIKSMRDFDRNEFCERCGAPGEPVFSPKVQILGASVQHAEYNPGLGQVVKNKRHRQEIAKRKGLVEIGSDYKAPENIHKEFESKRDDKRKKRWEEE